MGKQKQPVRAWAVIFWLLVWQLASMRARGHIRTGRCFWPPRGRGEAAGGAFCDG